jgi:hypothetical protein
VQIKLLFLLFFGSISHSAVAHTDTGHGKDWKNELGPSGGRLSSIVSAKEAEKGSRAETIAVAEWKDLPDSYEVRLWNRERTQELKPSGSAVKWIFLGEKLAKPIVVTTAPQENGEKSLRFLKSTPEIISQIHAIEHVEVILTDLPSFLGKSVFIFPLKKGKLSE